MSTRLGACSDRIRGATVPPEGTHPPHPTSPQRTSTNKEKKEKNNKKTTKQTTQSHQSQEPGPETLEAADGYRQAKRIAALAGA